MKVKLEDWEVKLLERLARNKDGKDLVRFLEKRIQEWSDLDSLTPENLASMKAAKVLLHSAVIDPIRNYREPKKTDNSEYV